MKKKQLLRGFLVVWAFTLVTSLAVVYGGGLGFYITQNGGGGDTVTYIDLGKVGNPVITLDGSTVSSGKTFTIPYDGKATILCTVRSPVTSVQPTMALFDITDILTPLDSGIQTERYGEHTQSVEVNWNELEKDRTTVQFRFWGKIDSVTYYSGSTFTFVLLRGVEPVATTTTTPPTTTPTTTPTTPTDTTPQYPLPDGPNPIYDPEYQMMIKTGYAMVIVVIHIIVLPIGLFAIARRKN